MRTEVGTFGVVGCGVIGGGWTVRALARGWDVVATDPAPGSEEKLRALVKRAWPSAVRLGLYPGASPDRLRFGTVADVVGRSDFVQECVPEDEAIKATVHEMLDAPPNVVVASSSSGLLPSRMQEHIPHPERFVVGHPFNPVYLLPLIEVVGGKATSDQTVAAATAVYEDLGMHPLVVRNEIEGYLSDRLQEAVWREILHLVADGIATTDELDRAIIYGPGLRWAGMGTNLTFHLAGGDAGMRHMLRQFGPALKLPWTKLEAPELTEELIDAMVTGTSAQADGRSIEELERLRDDYLIAVMRALRPAGIGAGAVLARQEGRRLAKGARRWRAGDVVPAPLDWYEGVVEPDWVDYNGHMTEAAYLTAFGWATDVLFRYIGDDEAYRESGHSFYTVETHINYLREASQFDPLRVATLVLDVDHKRLHIHHTMRHGDTGDVLGTTEQMLVHVDTEEGGSAPILPEVREALDAIAVAHRDVERPDTVMAIRR